MLPKHLQLLSELNTKLTEHSFLVDQDTIDFLKRSKVSSGFLSIDEGPFKDILDIVY